MPDPKDEIPDENVDEDFERWMDEEANKQIYEDETNHARND